MLSAPHTPIPLPPHKASFDIMFAAMLSTLAVVFIIVPRNSLCYPSHSHVVNKDRVLADPDKTAAPIEFPILFPWQMLGANFFQMDGASYLLVVDYFSRHPELT